jgi:hypothetical protein
VVAWRRWAAAGAAALRHGTGSGVEGAVAARKRAGAAAETPAKAAAVREHVTAVARRLSKEDALGIRRVRRRRMKKTKERDPIVRLKRVRSAFRVMTGRAGRMTGRGGGSVRSHSSKLLE